jgi:hypothetical protein
MRADRHEQADSRFSLCNKNASEHWILPAQCIRVFHVILTINWDHTPTEGPVVGLQIVTSSVYYEVGTEH